MKFSRVIKLSKKFKFYCRFTNCGTSVFAGIVVFSIIGFKATSTYETCLSDYGLQPGQNETLCSLQKELQNSASGTGLAFIVFTEAINQFPGAQLWAVMFFLMLFTLGIDSQFGTLEGVLTSLVDMKLFPNLPKEKITMVRKFSPKELTQVGNCKSGLFF